MSAIVLFGPVSYLVIGTLASVFLLVMTFVTIEFGHIVSQREVQLEKCEKARNALISNQTWGIKKACRSLDGFIITDPGYSNLVGLTEKLNELNDETSILDRVYGLPYRLIQVIDELKYTVLISLAVLFTTVIMFYALNEAYKSLSIFIGEAAVIFAVLKRNPSKNYRQYKKLVATLEHLLGLP
ncbi:MAG: hypothetical protein JRN15_15310 [Nitrososphaerota archaeon]|nr:hypothetical protein [Nitrososphaerota archaeon]